MHEPTGNAGMQEYYGKVLQSSKDLKTSACTAAGRPYPLLRRLMGAIPEEVLSRFYGCGAPVPLGIQGLQVLDLGSGSGRDCYLCAALVGEGGFVTGIDMTEEQLQVMLTSLRSGLHLYRALTCSTSCCERRMSLL